MNIAIKFLKGPQCTVRVTPETTIHEMKQEIEKIMKIPMEHQKIILMGRTLCDENTISTYPAITDGTKLNVIIKKPDPLREVIFRSFRKYYNEQQSEKLTREFMLDFEKKLKMLSLDDIERLADSLLSSAADQQ